MDENNSSNTETTSTQDKKKAELKLKAGIGCLLFFMLMIFAMLLTSTNGILLSLAIVAHISGMFLIATSGLAKRSFCYRCNWKNWGNPYSFNYSDPIFRANHRRHYDR